MFVFLIKTKAMKHILIILAILISSCAGKGGDTLIHVLLWKKDGYELWSGELNIYYNSKKLRPTKKVGDVGYIIDGVADFPDMKPGNYTIEFVATPDVQGCATQFKVNYRGNRDIVLREGEYIKQQS